MALRKGSTFFLSANLSLPFGNDFLILPSIIEINPFINQNSFSLALLSSSSAKSSHALHHFLHLGVIAHLFHHVHYIAGSSQLGHHLRSHHLLQFAHHLVWISRQVCLLGSSPPQICLSHLSNQSFQFFMFLQEDFYFGNTGSRSFCNSFDPILLIDGAISIEFFRSHGVHDIDKPFDSVDGLFLVVLVNEICACSREQRHKIVQRP